jgi:hypothetical protein
MLMIDSDHEKKPLGIFLVTRVTVHRPRWSAEHDKLTRISGHMRPRCTRHLPVNAVGLRRREAAEGGYPAAEEAE